MYNETIYHLYFGNDSFSCKFDFVQVFNRDELQAIADLCVEHDSLCFADEVYQWLVYGEKRKHIHIGRTLRLVYYRPF